MTLSIDDLFTPAPDGVGANPPPAGSWLDKLLTTASILGLATTAWQPGGMVRTIFAVVAKTLGVQDQVVSVMIKGGFLDPAATITPDPAQPSTWKRGSGWTAGWLDKLADGIYDVQRNPATYASGGLNVGNTSGNTYGPFDPGTYHVAAGSKTYHNRDTLTIPPGGVSPVTFDADLAGSVGTAAPGTIVSPVTSLLGVSVTNPAAFQGFDPESNAELVTRCRLKLKSLSSGGPSGAYEYFALTAAELLKAEATPVIINPITRVLVILDTVVGNVRVIVANASGKVRGIANLGINAVLFAGGGIEVQTVSAHGLATDDTVTISGVVGAIEANGTWKIVVVNPTKIHLVGSSSVSSYISGGVVEGGDLGEVDRILQENVVPDAVSAGAETATNHLLTIVYTAWVPASRVAGFAADVAGPALAAYVASLPIGGLTDPGGAYTRIVPFDGIQTALESSASYVKKVLVTLNGGTADVTLGATEVAVIDAITPTVHGV